MAMGRNRDGRREARWRRIIREQGRSGLGVRAFCSKSKLTENAFYFWRRELLRRDGERHEAEQEQRRLATHRARRRQAATVPAFVPVCVAEGTAARSAGGRIEIELSGGQRVHVVPPIDRQALADVLAVLEARSC